MEKDLKKCHEIAGEILNFEKEYAEVNGQIFNDVNCVYYEQPGENGYKLIVSIKDKSILWTEGLTPISSHITAFKEGLRTDIKILRKLYNI